MSTVFKLVQNVQDNPDVIQLLTNVTLTVPCAESGEEDTADTTTTNNQQMENQEGGPCKVIEECAIAFDEQGNFVRCQDQEENDPRADLILTFLVPFFPFG